MRLLTVKCLTIPAERIINLAADFGPIFTYQVDIRSHAIRRILREGTYEPELTQRIREHVDPAKDAIDIGANIGYHAIRLAFRLNDKRKVLAIEPTPGALVNLKSNISRNNLTDKIILFEGVASDAEGACEINCIPGLEEYSSLQELKHPAIDKTGSSKISVPSETVDNLVEQYDLKPGFIKMDIEGAETLALQGALKTLKEHRPKILTELSDPLLEGFGSSVDKVSQILGQVGYTLYDASAPSQKVVSPFDGEVIALPH